MSSVYVYGVCYLDVSGSEVWYPEGDSYKGDGIQEVRDSCGVLSSVNVYGVCYVDVPGSEMCG